MVETKPSIEGLSWNPVLTILETSHALVELSHSKNSNTGHQEELVHKTHARIFNWQGIERKLFFKFLELGEEFSKNKTEEKEFKGFVLSNNEWFFALKNEDTTLIPVEMLQSSEQIYRFRDEKVDRVMR
jgi:hypothetical protein